MAADNPLKNFLPLKGKPELADELKRYCILWSREIPYNAKVTEGIQTNTAPLFSALPLSSPTVNKIKMAHPKIGVLAFKRVNYHVNIKRNSRWSRCQQ